MKITEEELKVKRAEWNAEWDSNAELKEWLSSCMRDTSFDDFKKHIMLLKESTFQFGHFHKTQMEKCRNQGRDDAKELLGWILQKKLFDLQCQWRANQVTLEGIEIAYDFNMWARAIFECPCIPSIEPYELGLMKTFLQSPNATLDKDTSLFTSWQDYKELKEAYDTEEENENFPAWYDFHNTYTGGSRYFLLPDLRTPLENYYWDLKDGVEAEYKQLETEIRHLVPAIQSPIEPSDPRPSIGWYNQNQIGWFVNTFEPKEVQEAYKMYLHSERRMDNPDYEEVMQYMNWIDCFDRPIPTQSYFSFWEGLILSINRFLIANVLEVIDNVYDEYVRCLEENKPFVPRKSEQEMKRLFKEGLAGIMKEDFLTGRELAGEPRNFDI